MERVRVLIVFGTRPEAIKLAPVIHECQRRNDVVDLIVCSTGQHVEIVLPVVDHFGIHSDVSLGLLRSGQSLTRLVARCMVRLDRVLVRYRPDCVVVQGDTSTVFAASTSAFHRGVSLVHVEAGLRTGDLQSPWPEEFNRRVTTLAATLHCAPTQAAADNLRREGLPQDRVHVTGNTVIDALYWTLDRMRREPPSWQSDYPMVCHQPTVLITVHRRENLYGGLDRVCRAIRILAKRHPKVQFVWPVHLNPAVVRATRKRLDARPNIHLLGPLPYPVFVWMMDHATLILTDSGGIQEEAPSLGKRVLVMRDVTERPEAVACGAVELVGTNVERIVDRTSHLLCDQAARESFRVAQNPYGDGHAAERIVELMLNERCHCRMNPVGLAPVVARRSPRPSAH